MKTFPPDPPKERCERIEPESGLRCWREAAHYDDCLFDPDMEEAWENDDWMKELGNEIRNGE